MDRKLKSGCTCHEPFQHAHDGPALRLDLRHELKIEPVITEGRERQRGHDLGVENQYWTRRREIEREGGQVIGNTSELPVKRKVGSLFQELQALGYEAQAAELRRLVEPAGAVVGSDERVKIQDNLIVWKDHGGAVHVERQDYFSGGGRRLIIKIAAGFKIGGIGGLKVGGSGGRNISGSLKMGGQKHGQVRSGAKRGRDKLVVGDMRMGRGCRALDDPPLL